MSEVARHRLRAVVDADSARLAIVAAGQAAQDAVRRLAFEDAAYWYGVEADLAAPAERTEADRASALVRRADALHRGGQVTAALDEARRAVDLAEHGGLPQIAAAAALVVRNIGGPVSEEIAALCARARAIVPATETVAQAQLMGLHALALIESYRTAEAERLSREAMALAEATGDADALILAIQARQALDHGPGTLDVRRELSRRLAAIGEAAGRPEATLWAMLWRVDLTLQAGNLADLDAELRELEHHVSQLGWPLARWHLLRAQATRALLSGQLTLAADLAGQARDVAAQTQDVSAQGLYFAFVVDVYALLGRLDEIDESLRVIGASFEESSLLIGLATLGRNLLATGNHDRARTAMDRLRPTCRPRSTCGTCRRWPWAVSWRPGWATSRRRSCATRRCFRTGR